VKKLVDKYFGSIPPGPALDRPVKWIPKLDGTRTVETTDRVPQERVYMTWQSPAFFEPGDAEMDLIGLLLTDGLSSRLSQVDSNVVSGVFSWRRGSGSNRRIKVLQTFDGLPLNPFPSVFTLSRGPVSVRFLGPCQRTPIHAAVYFRWIIAGDELLERLLGSPQVRQSLHSSDSHAQKSRPSGAVSFGRFTERCKTPSWWRRARIST
jgi:hypothetical protein